MKTIGVGLFALVLWFSLCAVAQDTGGQQGSAPQGGQNASQPGQSGGYGNGGYGGGGYGGKKAGKAAHLQGKISDDGKTLTDKDGKSWTIENPDAVKGHEGHDVVLRGHMDKANNSIHVISLKMAGEKSKSKGGAMSEKPPQ